METQNFKQNSASSRVHDADDKRQQFKERKFPWQPDDWQLGGGALRSVLL